MNARARKMQREQEAAEIGEFFDAHGGKILDVEGETVGEGPAVPDTSIADAATAQAALETIPVRFSVNGEYIDRLRQEAAGVTFDTTDGYEKGRKLLALRRALNGGIERTRKAIKAPALSWGNRVDDTAKGLVSALDEIFDPLQALKDDADAEKARRRRAAEDAERDRIRLEQEALLAQQRAELEAQRAEQARIAEEQRQAREAAEAAQAEERRQLDAERAAMVAEREAIAAERARLAPPPTITEPAPVVTQEQIDTAVANVFAPANIPPDMIMRDWVSPPALAGEAAAIADFARQIRALKSPAVTSDTAAALIEQVEFMLAEAAQALESFETEAATAAE